MVSFLPIDAHCEDYDPEVAAITSSRPGAFFYYLSGNRVVCFRDPPVPLVATYRDTPVDTRTYHRGHRLWYGAVARVHEWL